MFESAEQGHRVSDAAFSRAEPGLRTALLDTQYAVLEQSRFPVVVVIGGVDGGGKGETLNLLTTWMDPRHIHAHAFGRASHEELDHPPMWRFWRTLPRKGRIAIYFDSWYTEPILDHALGGTGNRRLQRSIEKIFRFEQMLANEGAAVIKFWFHLSKKAQENRLKTLERDPLTRWRVTDTDWRHHKHYKTLRASSERVLQATSTPFAPWFVIEGADANYRHLVTSRLLLQAMKKRLSDNAAPRAARVTTPLARNTDGESPISALNLKQSLARGRYRVELAKQQGTLNLLSRSSRFRKRGVVAVFEGPDAAGKGGAIRRITAALDARFFQVVPISVPDTEELARPYLWRFWRHIPRLGRFTIFDRSWYGRVLVERVEGHASASEWSRAYGEINEFEQELADGGLIVVKFWLAISKQEQLARFRARQKTPYKQFKITRDDWRNRAKWDDYQAAAEDMVARTSTAAAPWTLIEANDKYFARIKVLKNLCERIEAAL
jgi:AMP-polyphosphate phosphotransferase